MRNFVLALLAVFCSALAVNVASAQGVGRAVTVTNCGNITYQPNLLNSFTLDVNGNNCVNVGYDNGVPITPVVQNAAYAGSNSLGGLQSVTAFRTTGQASAILTNFWLGSVGGATTGITVYIFDTNPTASTCTDKTAFSLNSADLAKLAVAPFVLTPATSQGTTMTTAQQAITASVKNQDATPTRNLYVCLVANGSVTPASVSDIVFKLSLSQD